MSKRYSKQSKRLTKTEAAELHETGRLLDALTGIERFVRGAAAAAPVEAAARVIALRMEFSERNWREYEEMASSALAAAAAAVETATMRPPHEDDAHELSELDWASRELQTVVIPGARQGVTDGSQQRFANALRREAKRRGLRITVTIASSQRVVHARVLGEVRS